MPQKKSSPAEGAVQNIQSNNSNNLGNDNKETALEKEGRISSDLKSLATQHLNPIALDEELKRIRKREGIGITVLRREYDKLRKQIKLEEQSNDIAAEQS